MPALEDMDCAKCGESCYRESVDIGVGIMYGPWGCPDCGWSENPEYDCSSGYSPAQQKQPDRVIDQFGCSHTKEYLDAGISRGLGQIFYTPNPEDPDWDPGEF